MAFDHTPQTQCTEDQKEPKEKRIVFCRGDGGAFGRGDSQERETGSGGANPRIWVIVHHPSHSPRGLGGLQGPAPGRPGTIDVTEARGGGREGYRRACGARRSLAGDAPAFAAEELSGGGPQVREEGVDMAAKK